SRRRCDRAAAGRISHHPAQPGGGPRSFGTMKISILTIFPDFFGAPFAEGMIRLAREKQELAIDVVNLRDFTDDSHRSTDDYPFGGGAGMIMKIEPIDRALGSVGAGERGRRPPGTRVVLFSPQGPKFT